MNAIISALDAHTTMSTQALNSPDVQRGLKDILLNHAALYERLRQSPVSAPTPECGGGFNVWSRDTLRCFNHMARGTCDNSRTITRQEIEARVLRAMQLRFFVGDEFDDFCRNFTDEMNRLRREHRTKVASIPHEIVGLDRRSKEILELLLQGFRDEAWKDELKSLDQRRTHLKAMLATAAKEPALPALQVVGNFGEMLTAANGRAEPAVVAYDGCGGPQHIVPAALLGGSVRAKTLTFPTEVPDVRRPLG